MEITFIYKNNIFLYIFQIVPYFVVSTFEKQPGMTGLFMAALFSGAMRLA